MFKQQSFEEGHPWIHSSPLSGLGSFKGSTQTTSFSLEAKHHGCPLVDDDDNNNNNDNVASMWKEKQKKQQINYEDPLKRTMAVCSA